MILRPAHPCACNRFLVLRRRQDWRSEKFPLLSNSFHLHSGRCKSPLIWRVSGVMPTPMCARTCEADILGTTGPKIHYKQSQLGESNRVQAERGLDFCNDRQRNRFGCSAAQIQSDRRSKSGCQISGKWSKVREQSFSSRRRAE